MESKKLNLFNKISFGLLLTSLFLSIFFFLPYAPLSLQAGKGFMISISVMLSFLFWLIARLIDGRFSVPKDRIILLAFLLSVVFFISSFFSSSINISLFGKGFELGTAGNMFILFLVLFLSSVYFQTEKRIVYFFKAIFLGSTILALFEILHIILNFQKLLPGLMKGVPSGNLFGSWNNFAIFIGGMIILALITIEIKTLNKLQKIWLLLLTLANLFLLTLVNNKFVWILVAIFSIIVFVYNISSQNFISKTQKTKEKDLPIVSFVVILISLLFLFSSNSLGTVIPNYFGITNNEVYPSFSSTMKVTKQALFQNPALGTGPNTFSIDWAMWKPEGVTLTQFWNYGFTGSQSFMLTTLSTVGVLGFSTIVLLLIIFLFRGAQSMFVLLKNTQANYFVFSSFLGALYFWIIIVLNSPNLVNTMLAFSFTGVFLGSLVYKKILDVYDGSYLNDPRSSFFSILGLVMFVIASFSMTYLYIGRFVGSIYVSNIQNYTGDVDYLEKAEKNLIKVLKITKNDNYYRMLSQVYLSSFNYFSSNKNISEDTARIEFQRLISKAEESALSATRLNSKYYINWINLGDVYAFFSSVGVDGAYDNAKNAYKNALKFSSESPSVLLAMAKLEILNKNNTEARRILEDALIKKPNYTDAMFELARIDTNEGKLTSAISRADRASVVSPNDPNVFFNLGILRYNNKNYTGAVSAFETAVRLSPQYMNARYFLGISYQKIGRTEEARAQLELLYKFFPENKEIISALDAIKNGESVIKDAEEVENLPIDEENIQ